MEQSATKIAANSPTEFNENGLVPQNVLNEDTPKLYKIGNCYSEYNHGNFSNIEFVPFATFKNNS